MLYAVIAALAIVAVSVVLGWYGYRVSCWFLSDLDDLS